MRAFNHAEADKNLFQFLDPKFQWDTLAAGAIHGSGIEVGQDFHDSRIRQRPPIAWPQCVIRTARSELVSCRFFPPDHQESRGRRASSTTAPNILLAWSSRPLSRWPSIPTRRDSRNSRKAAVDRLRRVWPAGSTPTTPREQQRYLPSRFNAPQDTYARRPPRRGYFRPLGLLDDLAKIIARLRGVRRVGQGSAAPARAPIGSVPFSRSPRKPSARPLRCHCQQHYHRVPALVLERRASPDASRCDPRVGGVAHGL